MVDVALSIGGVVGVLLSGGFVYVEIGRFATPQVPETLFEERREVFAYTAGLFVGIPLALALLLFLTSMVNGAIPGALLFLGILVVASEAAQWAILRSRYWGTGESGPFYALGFRAGVGGILVLTIVAQYLSGPSLAVGGLALVLIEAVAILGLEVAGALLSLPPSHALGRTGGGPVAGALFGAFGFFLIGIVSLSGTSTPTDEATAFASAIVALVGGVLMYRRLRPLLSAIPPPSARGPSPGRTAPAPYGRTDHAGNGEPLPDRRT